MELFQPVQPQDLKDSPSKREFVELGARLLRTLGRLLKVSWLDGVLLENVALTNAVEAAVPHGLGRVYRGFWAVRNSSGATLNETYSSTDRQTFVRITPSADATVSLVVF